MLSGLLLGDGWLTLGEVYGMRLDADVLVLSGCATGRAWVSEGDDLFGLVPRLPPRRRREPRHEPLARLRRVGRAASWSRFHLALARGRSPAAAMRAAALDRARRTSRTPTTGRPSC